MTETERAAQAVVEQDRHPDGTPWCRVCNDRHPVDSMVRHCLTTKTTSSRKATP